MASVGAAGIRWRTQRINGTTAQRLNRSTDKCPPSPSAASQKATRSTAPPAIGSRSCLPSTAASTTGISGRCATFRSKWNGGADVLRRRRERFREKHGSAARPPASFLQPWAKSKLTAGCRLCWSWEPGFNHEFTGHENVFLNGTILGLSTAEIKRRYNDIEQFAEIGDFINQPVKTYSSGMLVRLAFAVAINVDAEILLVDEALAVGDYYFRQRCMRKVHELHRRDVTIVFVSHAIADVKAIGTQAMWLENGQLVEIGKPGEVISKYLARMSEKDAAYVELHGAEAEAREDRSPPSRPRSSKRFPTSTSATATRTPRSSASPPSIPKGVRWNCSKPTAA